MKTYPSDLTDCQWQFIEKMMNDTRKRKKSLRTVWNAILYLLVSGCQWRMLPKENGPWESIYYYYRKWKKEGFIEEVHEQLVKKVRKHAGKEESPSVGIIDSQSSKTTSTAGEEIGYDAGKKIKGRKRHVVADTMGMLMTVVVHGADKQDRQAAETVIETLKYRFPRLTKIFADGGYAGQLLECVQKKFGWFIEIVKRTTHEFKILPKRWIVERTLAWINNCRRNSKDYERLCESSVAMVQLSMIRVMLNRIYQ